MFVVIYGSIARAKMQATGPSKVALLGSRLLVQNGASGWLSQSESARLFTESRLTCALAVVYVLGNSWREEAV